MPEPIAATPHPKPNSKPDSKPGELLADLPMSFEAFASLYQPSDTLRCIWMEMVEKLEMRPVFELIERAVRGELSHLVICHDALNRVLEVELYATIGNLLPLYWHHCRQADWVGVVVDQRAWQRNPTWLSVAAQDPRYLWCVSLGQAIAGRGANALILVDPLGVRTPTSADFQRRAHDYFDTTLAPRLMPGTCIAPGRRPGQRPDRGRRRCALQRRRLASLPRLCERLR